MKHIGYAVKYLICTVCCVLLAGAVSVPAYESGDIVGQTQLVFQETVSEEEPYLSSSWGSFTADAVRETAAAQIALIPSDMLLDTPPAGDITYADLVSCYEDVPLVLTTVSPEELEALLEEAYAGLAVDVGTETMDLEASDLSGLLQVSGLYFTVDPTMDPGERIYAWETEEEASDAGYLLVTTQSVIDMLPDAQLQIKTLSFGAADAAADYIAGSAYEDTEDLTSRITIIGTRDRQIVDLLPRWAWVVIPLILAVLIVIGNMHQKKYKDAHGVFLDHDRRD